MANRTTVRCDKGSCARIIDTNAIKRHQAVCDGSPQRPPSEHVLCRCGRIKHRATYCCFVCEDKDEAVFATLDYLIATGVSEPRETLEAKAKEVAA